MGSDAVQDGSTSIENASSGEMEDVSNNIDSLEVISSGGDITRELESAAEFLTRVELDLARSSEKLVNLDILVMHVASRENDFEAFCLDDEHAFKGSAERALEFDLLYGFLDSEVRELETFLSDLQTEIASSRGILSSFNHLADHFEVMEEKLLDCEESLKRSFQQVSDIKVQSANFRRILLSSSGDEKWKDNKDLGGLESGDLSALDVKIKMHTAEQQRHVLRMLEKSLAREMDLEKKLADSRQTEEDLKLSLEQEVLCQEEETEDLWERLFGAENSAEILLGVSKELFGQIQSAQFNINGSVQREQELRCKLQDLNEQLKERNGILHDSEISRTELLTKVNSLEEKLRELESQLHPMKDVSEPNYELQLEISKAESTSGDLKEKSSEAEMRAESAEAECKLLRESNLKLTEKLGFFNSSMADATERLEQLERQLKDSEIKRLHAEASAEASQERLNMLDCTIEDMENLIEDLKSKVSKAEGETESAEEKCIILSEANAEFIEEINFLRGKIKCLETSLYQADEAKKATAKDIRVRAKFIADLIMQLALERERLHKQISSLTEDKKVALKYMQQVNKDPSVTVVERPDAKVEKKIHSEEAIRNETSSNETNGEVVGSSATGHKVDNEPEDSLADETKTNSADSTSNTNTNTVRNIDARQLNFKYILMAFLVLVVPALVAFLYQQ